MQTGNTRVGRFDVPVRDAKFASIVAFRGGARGIGEAGHYLFWTAVLRNRRGKGIIGRAPITLPPGDRFDRMQFEMRRAKAPAERKAYRDLWVNLLRRGANIAYIRPSTAAEIRRWMVGHEADARYVTGVYLR